MHFKATETAYETDNPSVLLNGAIFVENVLFGTVFAQTLICALFDTLSYNIRFFASCQDFLYK